MYWVLVNRKGGRVLVTGRPSDVMELGDWEVVYKTERWDEAYEVALLIADDDDLILEWYLEDAVKRKKALTSLKSV